MELIRNFIRNIIPKPLFDRLQPLYHRSLSFVGAKMYGNPSRDLFVIGVTGTKGKSSVTEIMHAILIAAGIKAGLQSTIHFKIGEKEERNLFKMTMPGRFFVQKFMRRAIKEDCTHVVLEITSEAAKQYRHKHIELDAFIFTNLTPEHIESHGSFENYKNAKLSIANQLRISNKQNKIVISNIDDEHGEDFLNIETAKQIPYSIKDVHLIKEYPGIEFEYAGTVFRSPLQGYFNVLNILACVKLAEEMGIDPESVKKGLSTLLSIPGRVEYVDAGQPFPVVVDYAHTPDSLTQFYKSFPHPHKICVLGNTGGGRDGWKRPEMARIAEEYCETVILTNEDPYDEDPQQIVDQMAEGMQKKPIIILDRREAIKTALDNVQHNGIVLITGKGTDPYIMGPNGSKQEWSDVTVARELIQEMK